MKEDRNMFRSSFIAAVSSFRRCRQSAPSMLPVTVRGGCQPISSTVTRQASLLRSSLNATARTRNSSTTTALAS